MKNFKVGGNLLIIYAIFFVTYNTIYGWNNKAVSTGEHVCDIIAFILATTAFALYLTPLIRIYEKAVKKWDKEREYDKMVNELGKYIAEHMDKYFCHDCHDFFKKPDINKRCPKCGSTHWISLEHGDCSTCEDKDTCLNKEESVNVQEFKPGDKVHYAPHGEHGEASNGIVKYLGAEGTSTIFVVFNCAGDWDNYKNYTAAATHKEHLKAGWVK